MKKWILSILLLSLVGCSTKEQQDIKVYEHGVQEVVAFANQEVYVSQFMFGSITLLLEQFPYLTLEDGFYIASELTLTNKGNQTITVSSDQFFVVSEEDTAFNVVKVYNQNTQEESTSFVVELAPNEKVTLSLLFGVDEQIRNFALYYTATSYEYLKINQSY